MTVTEELVIRCPVVCAWALVSDVRRIGEFSPECIAAWWLPGSPPGRVGARFEGRNRIIDGDQTEDWIRVCQVVVFDPPHEFAWIVGDRFDGSPATRWAFRIHPHDHGCRIQQHFQHVPDGLSGLRLHAQAHSAQAAHLITARQRDLATGMRTTLYRISTVLTTCDDPQHNQPP